MQTNIDHEISELQNAVFGEEVRSAFISCMEKLHTVSETNASTVIEAEKTMKEVKENAIKALNDLAARLEAGEFNGPPGIQGEQGETGEKGDTGKTGERGSRWTEGTAITGTSITATVFNETGIVDALTNDMYLNSTLGTIYKCVLSGNASTAKWVYVGSLKGPKGDKGDTGPIGPVGSVDNIDDQKLTFEQSQKLENVKSGETLRIAFGKLMKAVSVLIEHYTQKATASILGHVKLSNSTAITTTGEYALDAVEKNAAVSGTLANQIAQQNSNISKKLTNNGYYNTETSINDMLTEGIYRFYSNRDSVNSSYLGWVGQTLLICSGNCAGFVYQIFCYVDGGHCVIRHNAVQGEIEFNYDLPLRRIDSKSEIAQLESRIKALETLVNN